MEELMKRNNDKVWGTLVLNASVLKSEEVGGLKSEL
jgi:hypothetical protein